MCGRYYDRAALHTGEDPGIYELVREQFIALVREHGLELYGPCRRVDLVVNGEKGAVRYFLLEVPVIGKNGRGRRLSACFQDG